MDKILVLSALLTLACGQAKAAGLALPGNGTVALFAAQPGQTRPAYASDVLRVAQTMGASVAVAEEARRQDLEETLSWVLMRCSANAGVGVPELMQRRKTMSWGEVASSCGLSWPTLIKDLRKRSEDAGLLPTPASATQLMRSASNDPDRLPSLDNNGGVRS